MSVITLRYSVSAQEDVGVVEGRIVNIKNPINSQDAATKDYVDNSIDMIPEPPAVLQDMGQSTTAVMSQKAVTDLINRQTIINLIYPVGSIYMSINSINPEILFGGSWVLWGSGRTPVCVNINDSDFNEAEKIGGEKAVTLNINQIPSHAGHVPNASYAWGDAGENTYVLDRNSGAVFQHATNRPYVLRAGNEMCIRSNSAGGNGSHNNLQPYITCYMWKRIA